MSELNGWVWARSRPLLPILWPDDYALREPYATRPLAHNAAVAAGLNEFVTARMFYECLSATDGSAIKTSTAFEQINDHAPQRDVL